MLNNDKILSALTVRLRSSENQQPVGSGFIYSGRHLGNIVYVITASHCLFLDPDQMSQPVGSVIVDFYNPLSNSYEERIHFIDYQLVSGDMDNDVAILKFDRHVILKITGALPEIKALRERTNITDFVFKGFPEATNGQELAKGEATWIQKMTGVNKFQLHLERDFSTAATAKYQVGGFSGSGMCLEAGNSIFLYGVFTRFNQAGKVIYCQFLESLNELLENNFLPLINYSFLGAAGVDEAFFRRNMEKSINDLGPRFTEEINFRTPIVEQFTDLVKGQKFKRKITLLVDSYFTRPNYNAGNYTMLAELEANFTAIRDGIDQWYSEISWAPDIIIDPSPVIKLIEAFKEEAYQKQRELHELQYEEWKKQDKEDGRRRNVHEQPYSGELNRIRAMISGNTELLTDLEDVNIHLTNHPYLIVDGEAGCGKSHLLGDITKFRVDQDRPSLLLLGQFFERGQDIWQNIFMQLGLPSDYDRELFLQALNLIGQQVGERVLLCIDALNEGAGKELWFQGLAGFIHAFKSYSFIGLALTVRSSYLHAVVPDNVRDNREYTHIKHTGFKGNEYAALQLFCQHYGIDQPHFPILAAEYANPLFLQLVCRSVLASGSKSFPEGFQGITEIFNQFIKHVAEKIFKKRLDKPLRVKTVLNAIDAFAFACYSKDGARSLSVPEAEQLFDDDFSDYPWLMDDLIEESLLIRANTNAYGEHLKDEIIHFAFERLGDYFTTERLLKDIKTQEDIIREGRQGGVIGNLAEDWIWRNQGIFETLAIVLPEKYNLEIFEVFDWVFKSEKDPGDIDDLKGWLNIWLIESMKWRSIGDINDEKITSWIQSEHADLEESRVFNFLLSVCAIKGHPFNSDRLTAILNRYTMPERDSFWQDFIYGYHGKDDNNIAFPVTRVIDWAWQPNISGKVDQETARLAGQTLAWFFPSTVRGLRDQATKAAVNLLEGQHEALLQILRSFEQVNDAYISERLYAVTYGVALRIRDQEKLKEIAQYVFDKIFSKDTPPDHVLLRDYARHTIEFALACGVTLNGNMKLIKPPYKSKLPDVIPTDEDIENYEIDHKDENFRQNYGSQNNQIKHSVMAWDFGRYTIEGALHYFSPRRFTFKTELDDYLKGLKRGGKTAFKTFTQYYELMARPKTNRAKGKNQLYDVLIDSLTKGYHQSEAELRKTMNTDQEVFFDQQIIPFLKQTEELKSGTHYFNSGDVKRWIVKRVFDLGYDAKIHGSYDSHTRDNDVRTESKVERIGKKYQWIAFHEILGCLIDNYKLRDSWGSGSQERYCQGAWELGVRDIDPSFLAKSKKERDYNTLKDAPGGETWWSKVPYNHWNREPDIWANTCNDLPDVITTIVKNDDMGVNWVYLNANFNWTVPKLVGQSEFHNDRKEIWYMVQAFLIPLSKADDTIRALSEQNFFGRWMPENHAQTDLLLRENYWAPISRQAARESSAWKTLDKIPFKVMLTTETGVGELSDDLSGAHHSFLMPCKILFDGLKLKYASRDGDFEDDHGKLVVTNQSPYGCLMRQQDLLDFAASKGLKVIWTLFGEKNSFNKDEKGRDFRRALSGVYSFTGSELKGDFKVYEW